MSNSYESRQYPLWPVPAVSGLILFQNKVLLVKRDQEPAKKLWALPGGAIHTGETPEEALNREIREECQIQVQIGELLQAESLMFTNQRNEIEYHYLVLTYCCHAQAESGIPQSDISQLEWCMYVDALNKSLAPGIKAIIQKYRHLIIEGEAFYE